MSPFVPNFETRKQVEAHPIVENGEGWVVVEKAGERVRVDVPLGFFAREMPVPGASMLVRYVDGYVSHCPRDRFLEDASPLTREAVEVCEAAVLRGPYRPDEQRVSDYLIHTAGDMGAGFDPIGFLIASHAGLVDALRAARKAPADLPRTDLPAPDVPRVPRREHPTGADPRLPPGRPHP